MCPRIRSGVIKKEPQRSCVGCGAKRAKQQLFRLVLDGEAQPVVDSRQVAGGRGVYLCGTGCLSAAHRRKVFQRAFRGKMMQLDLERLEAALSGRQEQYVKETRS